MSDYLRFGNPKESTRQIISLESSKKSDLDFVRFIQKNKTFHAQSHVVDLGCGSGAFSTFLSQQLGCKVTGVDFDPALIQDAKEKYANDPNLNFIQGSLPSPELQRLLPLADAVVFRQVLICLPQRMENLSWSKKLLKPDGMVFALEPDYSMTFIQPEPADWKDFYRLYSSYAFQNNEDWEMGRKLIELFSKAGLEITDFVPVVETHRASESEKFKKLIEADLYNVETDLKGLCEFHGKSPDFILNLLHGFRRLPENPQAFIQTQAFAICGR